MSDTAVNAEGAWLPSLPDATDTLVVIPTLNEAASIQTLVARLDAALANRDARIVFVDDSTDGTTEEIRRAASRSRTPVEVIHRTGRACVGGLSGAVIGGWGAFDSEYVVIMDGDLQHPPELVPVLRDAAGDVDLVLATRYADGGDSRGLNGHVRRLVSRASGLLARGMFPTRVGRNCTDPMTGFFCVRRAAVDPLRLDPRGFKLLVEILVTHDLRIREVPFRFGERSAGSSKASCRNGLLFLGQVISLRLARRSFADRPE